MGSKKYRVYLAETGGCRTLVWLKDSEEIQKIQKATDSSESMSESSSERGYFATIGNPPLLENGMDN